MDRISSFLDACSKSFDLNASQCARPRRAFNYIAVSWQPQSRSRPNRSRNAEGNRCTENQTHYPALEAPRQRRGLSRPVSWVLRPQTGARVLQSFVAVLALEALSKRSLKKREWKGVLRDGRKTQEETHTSPYPLS